eukprot:CAMPEP_0183314990 /NCGR_PEP_ID=MMETSP0160_2-20130417/50308_1 /TAXON_ID=2839 ORGANISM="Odontella Sinensis, Strain Grunow 1884" /NCGR_SAMPLE_ID=MMETSP0160_2 /ASSEMBLY_ACC=CAM_ASM_000250 /LENGTH=116 /DNA_ID=CAMNT_0025480447 /DNA_START=93 /DNA_END=440 /DNA_ORIENTATION=+
MSRSERRKIRRAYGDERADLFSSHDDTDNSGGIRRRRGGATPHNADGRGQDRDVAESLRRTNAMMQQGLESVSGLRGAIDSDGKILRDANEDHQGMSGNVKGARGTLLRLRAQEMW